MSTLLTFVTFRKHFPACNLYLTIFTNISAITWQDFPTFLHRYTTGHIWACPPSEGDDYIFHCHPLDQKIPKPKRLQEWYKKMLDKAVSERIVHDYKVTMDFFCVCRYNFSVLSFCNTLSRIKGTTFSLFG